MKKRKQEVSTVPLDSAPEVNLTLGALGLGKLDESDVSAFIGRNDMWAGKTSTGEKVFVKRLEGKSSDVQARVRRLENFELIRDGAGFSNFRTPGLLGASEEDGVFVFELIEDAKTGLEILAEDSFDEEISQECGQILGEVHSLPISVEMDKTPHPLPPVNLFEAVPLPLFAELSGGYIEGLKLIQGDRRVVKHIHELREIEASSPATPTHCDMRLDQFLLGPDGMYLTDWEEFRLADPARDLGAFVGEWVHRAIYGMASPGDQESEDGISNEKIISRGVKILEDYKPMIDAFLDGYKKSFQSEDESLSKRTASFAGWHLFERMLASSERSHRLTSFDRAAAGVGRNLLLFPESFVNTLGLEVL